MCLHVLITARVRSTREVFTAVCLLTFRGGGYLPFDFRGGGGGVPTFPGLAGGGGVPTLAEVQGGYLPWPGGGVPTLAGVGGTPPPG